MNSEKQVNPGSIIHIAVYTVVQMTPFKNYILFDLFTCRLSVWFVDLLCGLFKYSPHIYCKIFSLVVIWCYIYFMCGVDKVIRSVAIINQWTGEMIIWQTVLEA